jgi:hypothetical protein
MKIWLNGRRWHSGARTALWSEHCNTSIFDNHAGFRRRTSIFEVGCETQTTTTAGTRWGRPTTGTRIEEGLLRAICVELPDEAAA